MKKIIYLVITALVVLSCSIDGKNEESETMLDADSRSYAPWILCPTRGCGNQNMGLHQTHTYEYIKGEEHRSGKCGNCKREYYHKKDYTRQNTKHQCVMSGGCGYTAYSTQNINIKCITDPDEGSFIEHYSPRCYIGYHIYFKMRKGECIAESNWEEIYYIRPVSKKCSDSCKLYGSHKNVYTKKKYRYYCDQLLDIGDEIVPCPEIKDGYDRHHIACFK